MEAVAGREHDGNVKQNGKRERRRIIRQQCRVHIEMIVRCSAGATNDWSVNTIDVKGKLLDLSDEGAMLFTKQAFMEEQALRLTIYLPDEAPVATIVNVRWCKALEDKGGNASGVRFRKVSPEALAAIKHFLTRLQSGEFNEE